MAPQRASIKQTRRPDDEILDDIWRDLWNEEMIRIIDIHDISVDVEHGQVCLSGHVAKNDNQHCIEEIIWSIPGVMAVHNHLITDHHLSIQVAEALGDDKCTGPLTLPVFCYHGWVGLGGTVPNRDIQCVAEETAASVPAVRGVILLPDILGEYSASMRDAVQPGIGIRVYGNDETEGTVHQVVISPHNRLVTHAIVRIKLKQTSDGRLAWCDYIIPVVAMDVVDAGGIFLSQSAPAINQFPVLNPADYPFAPLTWQPPYPYAVGSVRWLRHSG